MTEKNIGHIIPYAHTDYAWTNYRAWHIERYVLIMSEVLDQMKQNSQFTWMTDNYQHFMEPLMTYLPERMDELKKHIREGRFEITSLIYSLLRPTTAGEETFINNIILGREIFQQYFPGIETDIYHNVDVSIGHSQLPQLMKLGGYKYLRAFRPQGVMDYKKYPSEFLWEGMDGTKVLCSRGIYAGFSNADENSIKDEINQVLDKSKIDHVWIPSGMDDTRPLRDYKDNHFDYFSFMEKWNNEEKTTLKFSTAKAYFNDIKDKNYDIFKGIIDPCDVGYNLPSKGQNGLWRLRVQLDTLIIKAETLCAMGALAGLDYPEEKLKKCWRGLLSISGHGMEFVMDRDFESIY
ncbi:MAG: hypothetical protein JXQ23_13765, partial [Clostridia bacterium]|nr:hypothetical protein [Clostridia bacterium]